MVLRFEREACSMVKILGKQQLITPPPPPDLPLPPCNIPRPLSQGGCVTSAAIDETYCLSFVMPNCTLHLGPMSPSDRYARESAGEAVLYLPGEPKRDEGNIKLRKRYELLGY